MSVGVATNETSSPKAGAGASSAGLKLSVLTPYRGRRTLPAIATVLRREAWRTLSREGLASFTASLSAAGRTSTAKAKKEDGPDGNLCRSRQEASFQADSPAATSPTASRTTAGHAPQGLFLSTSRPVRPQETT